MATRSPDEVKGHDAELTSGPAAWSWARRFRDVGPVTLQLEGGPASARLYCDAVDGLAEVGGSGGLAEAFLVEIFRCKLCRFTCGLKSAIGSHLLLAHGSPEEAGLQRPPLAYSLDFKHDHDDDDFLLYDMLRDIGAHAGLKVAHNCEVSSLFEDDASAFPVKTTSGVEDGGGEETAQSAHLMTLGLCRIAAARPPPETLASPATPPRPPVCAQAPSSDPPVQDAGKDSKTKNGAGRASKRRQAKRRAALKSGRRRTEEEEKRVESRDLGVAGGSRRVIGRADGKKKKNQLRSRMVGRRKGICLHAVSQEVVQQSDAAAPPGGPHRNQTLLLSHLLVRQQTQRVAAAARPHAHRWLAHARTLAHAHACRSKEGA
ncbi:uncharacterized protein LOC144044108 isoform X2 [Vanacampus margaritifer]